MNKKIIVRDDGSYITRQCADFLPAEFIVLQANSFFQHPLKITRTAIQLDEAGGYIAPATRAKIAELAGIAIAPGAIVGECELGAGVVIGRNAIISDGVVLGAGAVVGAESFIGRDTCLAPGARVGEHVYLGAENRVGRYNPDIFGHTLTIAPTVILGDKNLLETDVYIGPKSFIGDNNIFRAGGKFLYNTNIGRRGQFNENVYAGRNNVFYDDVRLGELTNIEDDCTLGNKVKIKKGGQLKNAVSLGGGTIVGPGARICAAVRAGRNCRINTCAEVHTHCILGDGVSVGKHAIIEAKAKVESGCAVLDNKKILTRTRISRQSEMPLLRA